MDYSLNVVNIKASVKLPNPVDLVFVANRCLEIGKNTTDIYCSKKTNNILSIRYKKHTFVLFKRSSVNNSQHCNITKCKTEQDITNAIQDLLYLVQEPPTFLDYSIDNYSCLARIKGSIDIESIYLKELDLTCSIQEVHFPSLHIRTPPLNIAPSSPNIVCQVYKNGCFTLVGGKVLSEIENFLKWILAKTGSYITT